MKYDKQISIGKTGFEQAETRANFEREQKLRTGYLWHKDRINILNKNNNSVKLSEAPDIQKKTDPASENRAKTENRLSECQSSQKKLHDIY